MTDSLYIERVRPSGFRAYLVGQDFLLWESNSPKSLAIFAANAKGKSSLIDAFEFFFSEYGTLERLGRQRIGTRAGPQALEHINAADREIERSVSISLIDTKGTTFSATRKISTPPESLPTPAKEAHSRCKTSFIVRGHELRRFVEEQTPHERYDEVSRWFGLAVLTAVQDDIRDLRIKLSNDLKKNPKREERLRDLIKLTNGAVADWDEVEILSWINRVVLSPIEQGLLLKTLSKDDSAYVKLTKLRQKQEQGTGLSNLRQAVDLIHEIDCLPDDEDGKTTGLISDFSDSLADLGTKRKTEQTAKKKAKKAVFQQVWEEAERLLEDDAVDITSCPVCDTPLERTSTSSRDGLLRHVSRCLADLKEYRETKEALRASEKVHQARQGALSSKLSSLRVSLETLRETDAIKAIDAAIAILSSDATDSRTPDLSKLASGLHASEQRLNAQIKKLEKSGSDQSYSSAERTIDGLIDLKMDLLHLDRVTDELSKIFEEIEKQEDQVVKRLRNYLQEKLDSLQNMTNEIYQFIHKSDDTPPPAVRFQLDVAARQRSLNLVIDFSDNRPGVAPAGYLSDSQIHTLALSLRLAAILLTNKGFPVAILDDVVTSYDADHRLAIASMISEKLSDLQVLIVTHDRQFFEQLRDALPQSKWRYRRITNIADGFGPKFQDHKVADEKIDELLKRGEPAGNDIRQAEEDWLLSKAREFGVDILIRDVSSPYQYDRAELASALANRLKRARIELPQVEGIRNPFLLSLQRGVVENFASHFSDDPQGWGSVGDEKTRWGMFKEFRNLFVCKCGGSVFKRPKGVDRPLCKKCEQPFEYRIDGISKEGPSSE